MKATGTSVIAFGGLGSIANSAMAQEADLPPLARDGNKLVDPSGNEVILQGVNIADPGEQSRPWRGQTAPETFQLATDESQGWYTNVVRVPVMPSFLAAGTRAPAPHEMPHGDDWGPALPGQFDASDVEWYCQTFLDDLVELGAQRGAYVMIDYHRHYPVFHQEDHKNHGVPDNVWKCNSDGGEDWRHPEVCGERGVLWHGEDQVDEIWNLIDEQNILEAFDLDEDDIFLEPPEVSNALDEELHTFWEVVADRYAGDDHVIFDVYNEPTGPYGGDWGGPQRQAGELSDPDVAPGDGDASNYDVAHEDMKAWYDLWVDRAQPWVDTVEENAPGHVITIGSPRWSQYTYWTPFNEFEAENMCYTAHVYTQDDLRPLETYFGQPSEHVPIFFSEFGWIEGGGMHVDTPWMDCSGEHDGNCEPYIEGYESFIRNHDIHPLAWSFDHTYEPNMFEHGTPGQNDGAKGADDWMNYLNDETPGVWWHQLNQELVDERHEPAAGDEPYPDADNGKNDKHIGDGPVDGDPYSGDDTLQVGEYEPQDPDGDGLYDDVNGDGQTTHADVNAFYENIDADGVQNNPDAFDFDGNGRIGFSDVLDLLRRI
ncbi:cellulase family glycosylhydrolase [Natrinema salaciae]|uniref:Cellulase (Glycosyl hydrolase family 5) n=1 Tax=Natrinema salaciae TaxID=1186196 RepID=A0A1H9IGQ3_9EURY|nr:cellulase family glycosylhydrolase [Natrinema salaciae]SEQ73901.1 Cellulase (glycosyl hydrolase family 5) [Natrinema salaciae]